MNLSSLTSLPIALRRAAATAKNDGSNSTTLASGMKTIVLFTAVFPDSRAPGQINMGDEVLFWVMWHYMPRTFHVPMPTPLPVRFAFQCFGFLIYHH